MKESVYTFTSLLESYYVEIPVIQRDYAHGRRNARAEFVRKSLIKSLWECVKQREELHLDFVYGRIYTSSNNLVLIPFDGQQRLTTLFLFYRYLYEKFDKIHYYDSIKGLLLKFSYRTRESAKKFCRMLCEKEIIENNKLIDIYDVDWFDVSWIHDPTVRGMIAVMQDIEEEVETNLVKNENNEVVAPSLSDLNKISFSLADMCALNMKDMNYISMNATGRPLTPWESFKASYLELQCHDREAATKFDTVWLDFFFNKCQKNEIEEFDDPILKMVQLYLYNMQNWEIALQINPDKIRLEAPVAGVAKFVPFSHYERIISQYGLSSLFNFFDYLSEHQNSHTALNMYKAVWHRTAKASRYDILNVGDFSHKERVAYFACTLLFENDNVSPGVLGEWMRFIWNILENSQVDSYETYATYLKLTKELYNNVIKNKKFTNIKQLWASISELEPEYYKSANVRIKEERLKASLLSSGKLAYKTIKDAESFVLCKGKLSLFLYDANSSEFSDLVLSNRLQKLASFYYNIQHKRVDTLWKVYSTVRNNYNTAFQAKDRFEIAVSDWKELLNNDSTTESQYVVWRKICRDYVWGEKHFDDQVSEPNNNLFTRLFQEHKEQILASYAQIWGWGSDFIRTKPNGYTPTCYRLDAYTDLEIKTMGGALQQGSGSRAEYDISAGTEAGRYVVIKKFNEKKIHEKEITADMLNTSSCASFDKALHRLFNEPELLFKVIKDGDVELCKMLITQGMNVNEVNSDGMTALELAQNDQHEEIVELLKQAGAK